MIMKKGAPTQTFTMMIAARAQSGSPSQGTGVRADQRDQAQLMEL
jgi:hypothetical protein